MRFSLTCKTLSDVKDEKQHREIFKDHENNFGYSVFHSQVIIRNSIHIVVNYCLVVRNIYADPNVNIVVNNAITSCVARNADAFSFINIVV